MTPWPAWVSSAVGLACSIVICAGIVFLYCFSTGNWSLLDPRPKHAPAFEFCWEGQFGNSCWDSQ